MANLMRLAIFHLQYFIIYGLVEPNLQALSHRH